MAGICDAISVDWFPHQIPFPKLTTDDYLTQTAKNMLDLIRQKLAPTRKKPIPSLTYGSKLLNAYTKMAKLLQRAPAMPVTTQIPASPPRVEVQGFAELLALQGHAEGVWPFWCRRLAVLNRM